MIKEMNFSDFEKIAQTLTLHISIGELMLKTKEFANVNKISVEEANAIFLTAHEIVKNVTIRDFINTRDRRIKELEKFQNKS